VVGGKTRKRNMNEERIDTEKAERKREGKEMGKELKGEKEKTKRSKVEREERDRSEFWTKIQRKYHYFGDTRSS